MKNQVFMTLSTFCEYFVTNKSKINKRQQEQSGEIDLQQTHRNERFLELSRKTPAFGGAK